MKAATSLRISFMAIILVSSSVLLHAQTGWKTFTHEKYRYSLKYPPDWEPKDMTTYMGFVSPKEGPNDILTENVNVVVEDHTAKPVTLDDLADANRAQIQELMGPEGKLVESKTTILGMPALKFDEQFETQGFKLHLNQYFVIKDNMGYVFTYTADMNSFDKYEPTILKIINTFKFPK